ncbi:aldose epimerase family protein [Pseudotabrizicola sp. 4114]|uniref:aldose epimerase family protein n=1 Tax=Pseudotabrizicola sp. 4114 TaxID=2817731 RepID=UPI002861A67D|nr:aldose 1-epimerase [Pseudorhodobacter sp. 4114]
MIVQEFGRMPEGTPVQEVVLDHGGLSARFISWGSVLCDLQLVVAGQRRAVVLGFGKLSDYILHARNHGANVGRYGGRIRDAHLVIDGIQSPLSRNLGGRHHSHGGVIGLGKRNWQLLDTGESWVTFGLHSPDGDEGYPGALDVTCRYDVGDLSLAVTIDAQVTMPSPVNFLHHSYFNLDGKGLIHDHRLQILADQVMEFDADGLPTGRILPVAESRFDFRTPRPIPRPAHYDASFVLDGGVMAQPRIAGRLFSGDGLLTMDVRTTEPGLHFYSGFAAKAPVHYLDGRPCVAETGLCLEATRFNDAMNQPGFGDVIVRPDRPYHQRTEFHFHRVC